MNGLSSLAAFQGATKELEKSSQSKEETSKPIIGEKKAQYSGVSGGQI